MLVARFFLTGIAVLVVLTACMLTSDEQEPDPDPATPTAETETPQPVATPTSTATATPEPTTTPAPTATPEPEPTPTPVPPTPTPEPTPEPTPDPNTEPVTWYIDDIAEKEYDGCCIEREWVYEQGGSYTSWVISYRGDGLRLTALMAVPHGDGPFPVAILNHGFFPFDQYDHGYDTLREVRFFASNGYIAIAPDYRNYAGSDPGEYIFEPGYVYDVHNLIRAIRELPEADADRIGMKGHSMGGGIAMQVIVSGGDVKVASLYGTVTANEVERYEARISRWVASGSTGSNRAIEFSDRYGTPDDVPDVYARMSVSSYWDRFNIPIIIHHGDADFTTPIEWAYDIEAGLRGAGKRVEMHVYPGAGHSFQGGDFDLMMQRTLAFFDAVLRPT